MYQVTDMPATMTRSTLNDPSRGDVTGRSVVEAERRRVVDVVGLIQEVHSHHQTGTTTKRL